MMTAGEYLELAARFAAMANVAPDPESRRQLQAFAESYRVLARSTAVLDRSAKTLDALELIRKT